MSTVYTFMSVPLQVGNQDVLERHILFSFETVSASSCNHIKVYLFSLGTFLACLYLCVNHFYLNCQFLVS